MPPRAPRRRVAILLDPAMHARWTAAARAQGQTLSGWIRWMCNRGRAMTTCAGGDASGRQRRAALPAAARRAAVFGLCWPPARQQGRHRRRLRLHGLARHAARRRWPQAAARGMGLSAGDEAACEPGAIRPPSSCHGALSQSVFRDRSVLDLWTRTSWVGMSRPR